MLRVFSHKSASAAKAYYAEGLKREDYYSEKQEIVGQWHGRAAEWLGLSGKVSSEEFAALAENRHPTNGGRLTQRTDADRIVGYDCNFHAPKSLSVLYGLTQDEAILKAFREAVAETMSEIETQAATRIRGRGENADRVTGNLAWAEFVHLTARPVGGIPDTHLHIHAFVFNSTFDETEQRWKAAKFHDIKKDAPYSQAVFHSRLTDKLTQLGYGIERTRQGWEVSGIPRSVIDKFSRRTAQIERLAEAKGITDSKAKDALGAASREGKRRGMTYADLLAAWGARLTPEEKAQIFKVGLDRQPASAKPKSMTPKQALDDACEKLFAKDSVVQTKRLVAEALRFGVGQVTPESVWRELGRSGMVVRQVGGESLCTSLGVLAEEVSLIHFVHTGRDKCAPLAGRNLKFNDAGLSAEKRAAVRHLLGSHDQVMAVRGVAGAGKTTLMKEAAAQIEARGKRVFAFAPSASASRETLRKEGFASAETVARLLVDPKLQERTRGQVIWIDEAGTVGVRDLWKIMQIAGNVGTRVILTGDTAQHAPVARGDAFRLLQQYAGLKVAEVRRIYRQEGATYRKAVAALSKGDLQKGFQRLDELGAIIEVADDAERYRLLAHDFLALSRRDSTPLVVSPTHAEAAKATAAIREAKREAGKLGSEKPFIQYQNLQWEEPDRRRAENYQAGLVVQFHQNAKGIRRGDLFRILGHDEKGGVRAVNGAGREIALPLKDADRFQVFEEREIRLARGDRLRITRNGWSEEGRRLNNGNVFTVQKFGRDGSVVLDTGATLPAKFGHLALGYVSTSHSAQSKSVRDVLVAQSGDSFLASSREQFYVSVSRGRESIRIYTDSRQALQEAVGNTSSRQAGIELAGFTSKEVASFMSTELNGRQWRDMIQSRRAEGAAKTHVQNLLKERRQDGLKKPDAMNFQQYLEMRRGMAGPDGKSRSKSGPNGNGEKKANIQNRGRSFLRPTQTPTPPKEKVAAANANKTQTAKPAEAQTRQSRFAKGLVAARDHFAKVSDKVKGAFLPKQNGEKRASQLPQSSVGQAARHGVKQRASSAAAAAKTQQAKAKTVQKAPTPAPVVRRGR